MTVVSPNLRLLELSSKNNSTLSNLFQPFLLYTYRTLYEVTPKSNLMKKVMALALCGIGMMLQAQSPQLHVKGIDSALVRMSQLKVSVKVVGNRAYTTSEMHFYNRTTRQMEAELVFPLPEGCCVSRYAIKNINGKLREAVPVDKNKGKQVFEAVEHRRVKPRIAGELAGNTFVRASILCFLAKNASS